MRPTLCQEKTRYPAGSWDMDINGGSRKPLSKKSKPITWPSGSTTNIFISTLPPEPWWSNYPHIRIIIQTGVKRPSERLNYSEPLPGRCNPQFKNLPEGYAFSLGAFPKAPHMTIGKDDTKIRSRVIGSPCPRSLFYCNKFNSKNQCSIWFNRTPTTGWTICKLRWNIQLIF